MWKKKDRLAGGRLEGCKERGEWAELYFMMQAAGRGMKVSRPFGQAGRYDVGVENPTEGRQAAVLRVQVKSTIYKRRNDEYSLNVMGPQRERYPNGVVDFFAVYLIPIDAWYIIPEKETRGKWSISLRTQCNHSRYEKYLEAWDLLRRPEFTGDIQACAEEFPTPSDWNAPDDACQLGALVKFTYYVDAQHSLSG